MESGQGHSKPEAAVLLAVEQLLDGEGPLAIESRLLDLGRSSVEAQASVRQASARLRRYRSSTAGKSTLLRSNVRKIVLGIILAVLAVAISALGQFSTFRDGRFRGFDWGPIAFGGVLGLLAIACAATGCAPLLRTRRRPSSLADATNANPERTVTIDLLDGREPSTILAVLEDNGIADADLIVAVAEARIRHWIVREEHVEGMREAIGLLVVGMILAPVGSFMFFVNQGHPFAAGARTASVVVAGLGFLFLQYGWRRRMTLRAAMPEAVPVGPIAPGQDHVEPTSEAIIRRRP